MIGLAHSMATAWENVFTAKEKLYSMLDLETADSEDWQKSQTAVCDRIIAHADELREWVLWNRAAYDAEAAGLYPVVQAYRDGLDHDAVEPAYKKAVYKGLAIQAIESDEALNMFSGNDFNGKVAQFKKIVIKVCKRFVLFGEASAE